MGHYRFIGWRALAHFLTFRHRWDAHGDCHCGINYYTYPWPHG